VVEAVPFGHRHQPWRSQLDSERREHRVARHRERERQRAAAFLATRIAQLDPVERRVRRVGKCCVRIGDPGLQDAAERDHLERRARRLQVIDAKSSHRQDLSRARLHRHHPAELTAECRDGGALHRRGNRRVQRGRGLRRGDSQHPGRSPRL